VVRVRAGFGGEERAGPVAFASTGALRLALPDRGEPQTRQSIALSPRPSRIVGRTR
jgi:hypothetical protein